MARAKDGPRVRRVRSLVLSIAATGLAVACVASGGDELEPPTGVRLFAEHEVSSEVAVPPNGQIGPVVEVTSDRAPILLSVTTPNASLIGERLSLIPADASPDVVQWHHGIAESALWGGLLTEPAWLFIPDPPAGSYQLVVSEELAGTTLGLQLHPVVEPSRADLVGSWQVPSADRFLHLEDDGNLRIDSKETDIGGAGTWEYTAGTLRFTLGRQRVVEVTLLPDGQLAWNVQEDETPVATTGSAEPEPDDDPWRRQPTLVGSMGVLTPADP